MWWLSDPSGATKAKARSSTGYLSRLTSSCDSRVAIMPAIPWSSMVRPTNCHCCRPELCGKPNFPLSATLILPLHRELEALREAEDAATRIGTTKRGIGPAYEDKIGRRAIRFMDLADLPALHGKIDRLLAHHNALRRGHNLPEIRAQTVYDHLAAIAPKVLPFMDTVWSLLDSKRREGKRILFEGAQGALLDINHGTYPYVTSSNTVAAQAATGSGLGP